MRQQGGGTRRARTSSPLSASKEASGLGKAAALQMTAVNVAATIASIEQDGRRAMPPGPVYVYTTKSGVGGVKGVTSYILKAEAAAGFTSAGKNTKQNMQSFRNAHTKQCGFTFEFGYGARYFGAGFVYITGDDCSELTG